MHMALATAAEDVFRLLLLMLAGVGLLMLGRWSSGLGRRRDSDFPADVPTPDVNDLLPDSAHTPRVWPPSAEQIAASFPYDPQLGEIRFQKFFFMKVDAIPGPADQAVFADELWVQLYDPASGHTWWQAYFVATPEGLGKVLREKGWKYLYAPQILVVPRYDLAEIRRAVVMRIVADHDFFADKENPEEDSL